MIFPLVSKFYFEEALLKSNLHNKVNPTACRKSILVNPKRIGINQFHNHMVGNTIVTNHIIIKLIALENLDPISIVVSFEVSVSFVREVHFLNIPF
jgi:hypothetical protein